MVVDLEEYRHLFQGVSNEVAIGEASTLYLSFPKAAERIQYHIPDVKLIAILRYPADRAYSAFMHALRDNYESITDFSSALAAEEERIKLNWVLLWRYQDQGFYYRQLKRYFGLFDSHQIKVYLYEDLVNNRSCLIRDVFDFIGVDQDFIPDTSAKYIAFLIHKRYIPDPEQLNQQRFKCAAQMREPLYHQFNHRNGKGG